MESIIALCLVMVWALVGAIVYVVLDTDEKGEK